LRTLISERIRNLDSLNEFGCVDPKAACIFVSGPVQRVDTTLIDKKVTDILGIELRRANFLHLRKSAWPKQL